jgi:hypothetical protein
MKEWRIIRMTLQLANDEMDRYDGLASLNWPSAPGREPKAIPVGAKVTAIQRGSFTTDSKGGTLVVNGWSQADVMRGSLNHAWQIWVRPELERYRTEGIALPTEIRSVLLKHEGDQMRLHINNMGGTGYLELRPGATVLKGDAVTFEMILDVCDITPPTHDGRATQYFLVRFDGHQVSIVFDLRPGQDDGPQDWENEDRQWYGSALAEQLLAGTYGHVVLGQQSLVSCDIPFSLGLPPAKMNAIAEASEISRAAVEEYLKGFVSVDDWKTVVSKWTTSAEWGRRGHLFEEALATYSAGYYASTVTLLIPQIEGVIMEFLVSHGKGLKVNGHLKQWEAVLNDLEAELRVRDYGHIRQTVVYTMLDFLRRSTLYSQFTWLEGGKLLGRHPILHGYEKNFGSKANSDRLLMLLDSLFWLIGIT